MRVSIALGCVAAMVGSARADELDRALDAVGGMVRGTIASTRRDVVVGPTVGGVVGATVDEGELTSGVSFGLAIYVFDSPSLRDRIKARVRERVKALVKEAIDRGEVPPEDLAALARQVATDVIAELSGRPAPKGLLDPPRFGVALEGLVVTSAGGGFQTRVTISKGVKRVSLGAMLGVVRAGGEFEMLGGVEASLRLTPIGTTWTPVVEPFVRVDAELQSELPFTVGAGVRLVADIF